LGLGQSARWGWAPANCDPHGAQGFRLIRTAEKKAGESEKKAKLADRPNFEEKKVQRQKKAKKATMFLDDFFHWKI